MQELIGNLTVEQFTRFIGILVGCVFVFIFCQCIAAAFVDGWAFRKGSLYYGSLRYLNKLFKKLKTTDIFQELDFTNAELRSVICLLRFQRVIPKVMYKHLLNKSVHIFEQRKSEFLDD